MCCGSKSKPQVLRYKVLDRYLRVVHSQFGRLFVNCRLGEPVVFPQLAWLFPLVAWFLRRSRRISRDAPPLFVLVCWLMALSGVGLMIFEDTQFLRQVDYHLRVLQLHLSHDLCVLFVVINLGLDLVFNTNVLECPSPLLAGDDSPNEVFFEGRPCFG